jgi:large subunit ribosomal protein L27
MFAVCRSPATLSYRPALAAPSLLACSTLDPSPCSLLLKRWATKKAGGITANNRKSQPKYLGLKVNHGEAVIAGNILIRQRGTKWKPKENVGVGRDHTIYSLIDGRMKFTRDKLTGRSFVSVIPHERCKQAFPRLTFNPVPPKLSKPRSPPPPPKDPQVKAKETARLKKYASYIAAGVPIPAEPKASDKAASATSASKVAAKPAKPAAAPKPKA